MKCAWQELMAVVPPKFARDVDRMGKEGLQQLRLRLGKQAEMEFQDKSVFLQVVEEQDIRQTVNAASQYSPWTAKTMEQGFITAPGGHRIGVCGESAGEGAAAMRSISSLNIRVARDFPGIASGIPTGGNILILGPPGCGKTTLLRDLIRRISKLEPICVVDERCELFPADFDSGPRTDILSGWSKQKGIDMALRTMAPSCIAVDEITADADCEALTQALWCGVKLIATAHASTKQDLLNRKVYRKIVESGCFSDLIILRPDKSWYSERMEL